MWIWLERLNLHSTDPGALQAAPSTFGHRDNELFFLVCFLYPPHRGQHLLDLLAGVGQLVAVGHMSGSLLVIQGGRRLLAAPDGPLLIILLDHLASFRRLGDLNGDDGGSFDLLELLVQDIDGKVTGGRAVARVLVEEESPHVGAADRDAWRSHVD